MFKQTSDFDGRIRYLKQQQTFSLVHSLEVQEVTSPNKLNQSKIEFMVTFGPLLPARRVHFSKSR